jgi:NAD(P)-dependent dehydrogenase (short-subunit alcohol dehydrogenase family)
METLHGKTGIVTGGASGVGRAIAVALTGEGAFSRYNRHITLYFSRFQA